MPLLADHARTPSRRVGLLIAALIAGGFGLTLLVFYPGVMTYDAKFVHEDIAKSVLGDWQSPVMTVLWGWIDPIAPGPASMFLLIAGLYWLAYGLLAFAVARRLTWLAILLPVLALSPPAFLFVGIIWRDVLLAHLWLLAAVLAYSVADGNARLRVPAQGLALALVALGFLLRPNALFAAPILAAYIIWPARFAWKRAAILFVPAALGLFGLMQVVYYGVLGATRQHIEQSIMVFDLGGISHFTKENQFPGTWTEDEGRRITNGCYKPTEWDIYWRLEPCQFVMAKLEKEQHLFGTPAVTAAWLHTITRHPVAYLEHRAAFFWNFLSADNLTFWRYDLDDSTKLPLAGRPSMVVLAAIDDSLKPSPLLRVGAWFLLCVAVCLIGWRHSGTPTGAFALGVCGSAVIYVLTFFPLGVASDFRYGYWAVLAGISGAVVAGVQGVRRSPA